MLRKRLSLGDATLSTNLSGKSDIVTGANWVSARKRLASWRGRADTSYWPGRGAGADEEAAESFSGLQGSHEVMRLDLADLQSVRDFVAEFTSEHDRLDCLACDAGLVPMGKGPECTKDGLKVASAMSYFSHCLPTSCLRSCYRTLCARVQLHAWRSSHRWCTPAATRTGRT